jgi:hypothetical protein
LVVVVRSWEIELLQRNGCILDMQMSRRVSGEEGRSEERMRKGMKREEDGGHTKMGSL